MIRHENCRRNTGKKVHQALFFFANSSGISLASKWEINLVQRTFKEIT